MRPFQAIDRRESNQRIQAQSEARACAIRYFVELSGEGQTMIDTLTGEDILVFPTLFLEEPIFTFGASIIDGPDGSVPKISAVVLGYSLDNTGGETLYSGAEIGVRADRTDSGGLMLLRFSLQFEDYALRAKSAMNEAP